MSPVPDEAFVFDLHLNCGGFAYFSTVTTWGGFGENNRDRRAPSLTLTEPFERALVALGRKGYLVESEAHVDYWLLRRGWAIVPPQVAFDLLPQFLRERECVRSAAETFTDVSLLSPEASARIAGRGVRREVTERDGGACLLCGRSSSDGASLTMQHVRPWSLGGDSTTRNLVLLCAHCNQRLANEYAPELFSLAGLPHGLDMGLLQAEITQESIQWARVISQNLMHTRATVY